METFCWFFTLWNRQRLNQVCVTFIVLPKVFTWGLKLCGSFKGLNSPLDSFYSTYSSGREFLNDVVVLSFFTIIHRAIVLFLYFSYTLPINRFLLNRTAVVKPLQELIPEKIALIFLISMDHASELKGIVMVMSFHIFEELKGLTLRRLCAINPGSFGLPISFYLICSQHSRGRRLIKLNSLAGNSRAYLKLKFGGTATLLEDALFYADVLEPISPLRRRRTCLGAITSMIFLKQDERVARLFQGLFFIPSIHERFLRYWDIGLLRWNVWYSFKSLTCQREGRWESELLLLRRPTWWIDTAMMVDAGLLLVPGSDVWELDRATFGEDVWTWSFVLGIAWHSNIALFLRRGSLFFVHS